MSEVTAISVTQLGAEPPGPAPVPPPGPIAQSVAIGFRAVYIAGALLMILWLTSNVREIASDSQAVVLRFGRIVRSQASGLLVAWPRPHRAGAAAARAGTTVDAGSHPTRAGE